MGLFGSKKKDDPQEVVIVDPKEKKSFTEQLFGSKKNKKVAFSREWRVTCKIRKYGSFVIRARDSTDAEDKLYEKIKAEGLPNRYYWEVREITQE
jgi:hypothetical protein